jgi:hypothetical protein
MPTLRENADWLGCCTRRDHSACHAQLYPVAPRGRKGLARPNRGLATTTRTRWRPACFIRRRSRCGSCLRPIEFVMARLRGTGAEASQRPSLSLLTPLRASTVSSGEGPRQNMLVKSGRNLRRGGAYRRSEASGVVGSSDRGSQNTTLRTLTNAKASWIVILNGSCQ